MLRDAFGPGGSVRGSIELHEVPTGCSTPGVVRRCRASFADCLEVDLAEALSVERPNQTIAGQSVDHDEGV